MSDAIALPKRRARGRFRKVLPAYVLIAPAIVSSVVFLYIPIVFSGYWSFTKYNGLASPKWVGFQNYTDLLSDPHFQKALLNTVIFVLIGMGIGPVLGLMSALLLNQAVRGRGFFRTAYFLPVMTSLVVVATIWKVLLNQHGIVNQLLGVFSIPAHNWLGDPSTALVSVAVTSIWQGFGFETVVFLAALQSVPRDLYDAALVDGADAWQRFRFVTLPALRPTIAFVYIIGIIGSFQVYDQIFVMTSGGPLNSTRTVVFDLVDRFDSLKYGEASAVAYILLVILATLSYVQMRLFEERS
ncbi:MAG TPA: sugar ABC transporter permease [Actinomycetota bacterium]|jgi:multiple sugar transport system permease protein